MASVAATPFQVSLDFFSGPLDLLLHLVRKQELPIEKVQMAPVADQYLKIVQNARNLDLELSTEYLVVAATLVALKSESVLPAVSNDDELADLDENSDVYRELRERLRRYEQVKLQAHELRSRPILGLDTFTRVDRSLRPQVDVSQIECDEGAHSLAEAFVRLLKRIGETARTLRVRLDPVSVVDYMMRVVSNLQSSSREGSFLGFVKHSLWSEYSAPKDVPPEKAKAVVIGSFIAVLELVKRGLVSVHQNGHQADFELHLRMSPADGLEGFDLSDVEEDPKIVPIEKGRELREAHRENRSEEPELLREVNRD